MTPPGAGRDDESLRQRFERRKAEITAMPDLDAAIREATQLGEDMEVFRQEAAQLRSELVARLRSSRGLSMQGVADRLGLAKRTVQQILDYGKPRRPRRR